MTRNIGRPFKKDEGNSKQMIIDATVRLIKEKGADSITVRNVCSEADISSGTFYFHFRNKDDLLMSFLKDTEFETLELFAPLHDPSERSIELYMVLIRRYQELGLDFMKHFYSTGNKSLSAYMGESEGKFPPGTIMARHEAEMESAQKDGYISRSADIHQLCMDICTIVKGCIFEWCLRDGQFDIESQMRRIVNNYMQYYV